MRLLKGVFIGILTLLLACGGGGGGGDTCDKCNTNSDCKGDRICAETEAGGKRCFSPGVPVCLTNSNLLASSAGSDLEEGTFCSVCERDEDCEETQLCELTEDDIYVCVSPGVVRCGVEVEMAP